MTGNDSELMACLMALSNNGDSNNDDDLFCDLSNSFLNDKTAFLTATVNSDDDDNNKDSSFANNHLLCSATPSLPWSPHLARLETDVCPQICPQVPLSTPAQHTEPCPQQQTSSLPQPCPQQQPRQQQNKPKPSGESLLSSLFKKDQVATKKESAKSAREKVKKELFQRFSVQIPLLTLRPLLKNSHDVFGHIIHIVDAVLWSQVNKHACSLQKQQQNQHHSKPVFAKLIVQEQDFMCVFPLAKFSNLLHSNGGLFTATRWVLAMCNFEQASLPKQNQAAVRRSSKHIQSLCAFNLKTSTLHVFDFNSTPIESKVVDEIFSERSNNKQQITSSPATKIKVHHFGQFFANTTSLGEKPKIAEEKTQKKRGQKRGHSRNEKILLERTRASGNSGSGGGGGTRQGGFDMSFMCKRKLCTAFLLLSATCAPASEEDEKDVLLETFRELQVLQSQRKLDELLQLYAQSILYYALDNNEVVGLATRYFKQQAAHITSLMECVYTQTQIKPTLPAKRIGSAYIGKAKGKLDDHICCIVINACAGAHIHFDLLATTNLFELFIKAAQCPRESEFSYGDLHKYLPDIFPEDPESNFVAQDGEGLALRSPAYETLDPEMCFRPLKQLLWAEATNPQQLFLLNGKTLKIEIELRKIEPQRQQHEQQQQQQQFSGGYFSRFVKALALGPSTIIDFEWDNWVSVLNERNVPQGIYYRDPSFSEEEAKKQLKLVPGFEVSKYQTIQRMIDNGTKTDQMGLKKLRFFKDEFHGIWKGSRTAGLAVRRHYKDGQVCIITFKTGQAFLQACGRKGEGGGERGFLQVVDFKPSSVLATANDSFVVSTAEQIARIFNDSCLFSETLMCVDDYGLCKVYLRGHDNDSNAALDARSILDRCANCVVAQNDQEWGEMLSRLPLADRRELRKEGKEETEDIRHIQDFQLQYAQGKCAYRIEVKANAGSLRAQAQKAMCGAMFSCFELHSVRGKNIHYLTSIKDVIANVLGVAKQQMDKYQVSGFRKVETTNHFEAHLPRFGCECCRTPSVCINAVSAILFMINVLSLGRMKNINTTVRGLQGKELESKPQDINVGLRCKHDWTRGLRDMKFKATVGQHSAPDLVIVDCEEHVKLFVSASSSVCKVLHIFT